VTWYEMSTVTGGSGDGGDRLFASTPTPATSASTSNAAAKLSAMMSVNAPGAVWCNTWHGAFIAMEDF
jgi:hypothetical protein